MFRYLALSLCLVIPTLSPAQTVTIGIGDTNRVALSFENGQFGGALARLYQCAMDSAGLEYRVNFFPQVRILHMLEKGEIDLGLPLAKLAERDEYAVFTLPLLETRFHLFTRQDIDPQSDLSGYTFSVLRASASARVAASHNANFVEVASWIQALSLARLGRFDGALIPAPIVADIGEDQLDGLKRIDFGSIPVSIYVSRKIDNTEELVTRLNAAIKECVP